MKILRRSHEMNWPRLHYGNSMVCAVGFEYISFVNVADLNHVVFRKRGGGWYIGIKHNTSTGKVEFLGEKYPCRIAAWAAARIGQ